MYYDVAVQRIGELGVEEYRYFACGLAVTCIVKLPIGIGHTGLDFCGVRKTFV